MLLLLLSLKSMRELAPLLLPVSKIQGRHHFGLDVETETVDDNHFRARVLVCTSPTFCRWVFGWCGRMKIESPAFVLDEYHRMARVVLE